MFNHEVNDHTYLRLLELRDSGTIFALVNESRDHLREWLPFVDRTRTVQEIEDFIRSGLQRFAAGNGAELGIWHSGELVGVLGLHYIDWPNRSTSLGYWLAEGFQGRGIMTQACRALIDVLFSDYELNRVEIEVAPENLRSRAIPERLGFQNEGCRRQVERLDQQYLDHIIYGLLARDWKD